MLKFERFINDLMTSNCYIVYDSSTRHCIVVDPGSEKCLKEIAFIEENRLDVDYVILTHEHTDHTWGCNTLIDKYDSKVVCSAACAKALPDEGASYFRFYYDDPDYSYAVKRVDIIVEDVGDAIEWGDNTIHFLHTQGHSNGSVCFEFQNHLFTGDTLMQYKPYIDKRKGSISQYRESVKQLVEQYEHTDTTVFPGHGDSFVLGEFVDNYKILNENE